MGRVVGWRRGNVLPNPETNWTTERERYDHERAVGRGHEAENRILKRSIIQFSAAAMSSCSNGRQSELWMTNEEELSWYV